ncbi:MAG TPA: competence/damage-inducible protein A [Actinomycetota bacterium]|nr:competence/damage-inducible protein A [Actinomycetota bacterium]
MRAEVIGVGTEILLGQIANTNARWISERLAEIGVDVLHHQVVGDNVGRIADTFRLALSRAEVVIATGGLGPTGDDVTRQGLAGALSVPLERRPEIEEYLREKFRRLGREMPESNLVQADVPAGARYILPERGTAPGLVAEAGGRRVYVVPGVPAEMREMMEGTILPELRELAGRLTIVSRLLRTTGVAEARVAELLEDLFEGSVNPTVAYLAGSGEVRVRLTAKAETPEAAAALIEPVEAEVRARLGDAVFGVGEEEVLERVVGRLLRERGLTLACAESLTGGGLAARITSVPGASAYFRGSAVCYAPEAKRDLLAVPQEIVDGFGTVSEECALAMAAGARKAFGADVGLAATGVAGPDPLEGKPPGTVFVALAADGAEQARGFRAPGDREQIRRWAEQAALDLLRRHLAAG